MDTLSKTQQIKFKKDTSGFKIYLDVLDNTLKNIDFEIINKHNPVTLIELTRLKNYLEKDIKNTNKRIEMIK